MWHHLHLRFSVYSCNTIQNEPAVATRVCPTPTQSHTSSSQASFRLARRYLRVRDASSTLSHHKPPMVGRCLRQAHTQTHTHAPPYHQHYTDIEQHVPELPLEPGRPLLAQPLPPLHRAPQPACRLPPMRTCGQSPCAHEMVASDGRDLHTSAPLTLSGAGVDTPGLQDHESCQDYLNVVRMHVWRGPFNAPPPSASSPRPPRAPSGAPSCSPSR
jgi:hypothetical protein